MTTPVETKELHPALWTDLEALFGLRGACGGCWCWAWRLQRGEKWKDIAGATAKERLRAGVADGTIHGILAYSEGKPVGWCTFGPRPEFPKLDRAPSFKCDDAQDVWSIPCFFVERRHRNLGVARTMLEHAIRAMKARGVKIVEGYPAKPGADGRYIDAFSWTGTRSLFQKAGFTIAGNPEGGKQRVRKILAK